MKWITIESEKDLPKGGIGKKLFIKHKGERYVLFMGYEGWQWVTGFLIKDEDWPHIEWLDESINQKGNPNISHKLEKVAGKAVGEQDKDIQISLLESKIEEQEEDLRNARNTNEVWLKNENINQEGSLKDSDWKEKIEMVCLKNDIDPEIQDELIDALAPNECKGEHKSDCSGIGEWGIDENKCDCKNKGDDLVAEASNSDLTALATLRSTVETQIEQEKEFPNFSIIQALCRCALAGCEKDNNAVPHQIERLKESLQKEGYNKEAADLENLLKPDASEMSGFKIVQSKGEFK